MTTFSEYAVVSENWCVWLPDGITMDLAVLFGCAVPTGAGYHDEHHSAEKGEYYSAIRSWRDRIEHFDDYSALRMFHGNCRGCGGN